jgi:hypothetical protein
LAGFFAVRVRRGNRDGRAPSCYTKNRGFSPKGQPLLASDIVQLVESDGLNTLAQMFACSRRSAEQAYIRAKRTLNAGYNVQVLPGTDVGTVRTPQVATEEPQEDTEPQSVEELAQVRARRINGQSYGQRSHDVGLLRGRISTLEKNVSRGYQEWTHELALCRRTLEILEGTTA